MHRFGMLTRLLVGAWVVLGAAGLFADELDPVVEAQVALDWLGVSPGIIDGKLGPRTASAVIVFQQLRGLEVTGQLDAATMSVLRKAGGPRLVVRLLQPADLEGLTPIPEDWVARSRMRRLDHQTLLERLAERSHVTTEVLSKMNPGVNWSASTPGQAVRMFDFSGSWVAPAARVEVSLANRTVAVIGGDNKLIARFCCSIAANPDKRPAGTFEVTTVLSEPPYAFDPALYPESGVQQKLTIPPGPNNPVGIVWIGISKPGFGLHGTPDPEEVGRTGSHGCFRLTNWDAERLAHMVKPGTPVVVKP